MESKPSIEQVSYEDKSAPCEAVHCCDTHSLQSKVASTDLGCIAAEFPTVFRGTFPIQSAGNHHKWARLAGCKKFPA